MKRPTWQRTEASSQQPYEGAILEDGPSASVQPLGEQSLSEAPYVLKSHETLRARTTLLSHSQISDTETVR